MKRILIIEDDTQLQKAYQKKLTLEGFTVLQATTGQQGLSLLKSRPDLVILDIMLPGGLNGFDVLEQIRRDPALQTLPILVLTNLDSEVKTAQDLGTVGYFVKANTAIDTIVEKIKSCLM